MNINTQPQIPSKLKELSHIQRCNKPTDAQHYQELLDAPSPKDKSSVQITAQEQQAYVQRNAKQAKKNPSLDFLLNDPQKFMQDMSDRFNKQKALTPETPYQFDFSEVGMPLLEQLSEQLSEEKLTIQSKLEKHKNKSFIRKVISRHSEKDFQAGIQLIDSIAKRVEEHQKDGKINYKDTQSIAKFSAEAMGIFDLDEISLFERNFLRIDRYLLGHKNWAPQDLQRKFEQKDFTLFDAKAGDKGTRWAQDPFAQDFFHPQELKVLSVPVANDLGPGVFMRLLPHDIFLMGVANRPAAADGFNRPGGDFYKHDLRHASSIYSKRKLYESKLNLDTSQIEKLAKKQDIWAEELRLARKKLPTKEMRYAVGFLSFNLHHDRGLPQIPSSFIPEKGSDVTMKLYKALKISGQPTGFDNPKETLQSAYKWLRNFWLERLPQEEAIVAAGNSSQGLLAHEKQ